MNNHVDSIATDLDRNCEHFGCWTFNIPSMHAFIALLLSGSATILLAVSPFGICVIYGLLELVGLDRQTLVK